MRTVRRFVPVALLAVGVLLVFVGMSAALGFTPGGALASLAAIVALLYAGAVWFSPAAARPVAPVPVGALLVVFDREHRIVAGPAAGQPVASQFPDAMRDEIDRRCAAALSGASTRFPCFLDGRPHAFDALPVRSADGVIVYGILMAADTVPSAVAVSA